MEEPGVGIVGPAAEGVAVMHRDDHLHASGLQVTDMKQQQVTAVIV